MAVISAHVRFRYDPIRTKPVIQTYCLPCPALRAGSQTLVIQHEKVTRLAPVHARCDDAALV